MKTRAREDQLIVSYLLGLASELEQSQIESRYFKDQHFYEKVLVVEDELICEYISNELTAAERRQFEKHFLDSAQRQKKYESTRKLMAYIADQGYQQQSLPSHNPSVSNSPLSLLDWFGGLLTPKMSLGWMVITTALLLFCGAALTKHVASLRSEAARTELARITLQEQEQKLAGVTLRQREEAAAKLNEAASLSELVASGAENLSTSINKSDPKNSTLIRLSLATARAATNPLVVQLPHTATPSAQVALELENQTHSFTQYLVKLRTTANDAQSWQWEVTRNNQQLFLVLPLQDIKPGVYNLSLSGITPNRANEFVGERFIRFQRD